MKKSAIALAVAACLAAALAGPIAPAKAGDGGAIAAGVIGGLAAGAIIGGAMAPRPYYGPPPVMVEERVYVEPAPEMCVTHREVWSERYRAYVVRKVRVPC